MCTWSKVGYSAVGARTIHVDGANSSHEAALVRRSVPTIPAELCNLSLAARSPSKCQTRTSQFPQVAFSNQTSCWTRQKATRIKSKVRRWEWLGQVSPSEGSDPLTTLKEGKNLLVGLASSGENGCMMSDRSSMRLRIFATGDFVEPFCPNQRVRCSPVPLDSAAFRSFVLT
ncbi:hypothetical protein H310_01775 [Aphanomyces invadans]|uniref:Uncharacterized protein n=1 Tax=Aphanomyces invadans TaxID=157072 RepID=A0A024UL19_9STRA|nr:hypothetical protein H310_01775 [Aphanomyces invadans]ETW07146.1 hypothetical protein H310_01775 [Aphanomyces invadans]|eukprot:XP_008863239.1 hypothetical protein H310_01775 [Aphanomyces invadans]